MKKMLIIGLLVALAGGCDTVSKKEFADLSARVAGNEKAAADAMSAAKAAQGADTQAVSNAQATADKALAAAQEASERAQRISETCCTRK